MKKYKIAISGMHCASCGGNVEKSVGSIKGVSSVRASVMTHKAIVEAEDSVDVESIKKAVEKVGYKVEKIE